MVTVVFRGGTVYRGTGMRIIVSRLIPSFVVVLGGMHEVLAQATQSGPAAGAPTLWEALVQMLPMLAICYLIFYFLVIRPQDTKTKQHKALLEGLKRGDAVVTTGGLVAKVSSVEGDHVLLEVAPSVKVKFLTSAIARLEGESQKSKAA